MSSDGNVYPCPYWLDQVIDRVADLLVPLRLPETVAVVLASTFIVFTVNVAVVFPAAMVTVAGDVATPWLVESVITKPPVGAALLMVTVPVDDFPPTTLAGLRVSDTRVGGLMVIAPVCVIEPSVPLMTAVVCDATANVLMVKVAEDLPEATVTDAGTVAELLLLDSLTTKPPDGAAAVRVAVPIADAPPTTLAGATFTETSVGGLIVRVAFTDTPLRVAVIVALVCVETETVLTVNVPEVLPAAIVKVAGTVADVLLLESLIVNPALGAGPVNEIVAVDDDPPATLVGFNAIDCRPIGLTVKEAFSVTAPIVAVTYPIC